MQSVLHAVVEPKKELRDLEGRVAVVIGGALGIGYVIPSFRIRLIVRRMICPLP